MGFDQFVCHGYIRFKTKGFPNAVTKAAFLFAFAALVCGAAIGLLISRWGICFTL
jgi:hypothetical protein